MPHPVSLGLSLIHIWFGIPIDMEEANRRFLPRWQEAPLLRGELVLLLGENLTASLADTTLRLSLIHI